MTADQHHSHYIEVSAILNHKVDNIIVEMLKLIKRVKQGDRDPKEGVEMYGVSKRYSLAKRMSHCFAGDKGQYERGSKKENGEVADKNNLWMKIIHKKPWRRIMSRSCENLL